MSAFKVLKKFNTGRKNRHKATSLDRSSSNVHIKKFSSVSSAKSVELLNESEPLRRRASTIAGEEVSYKPDLVVECPPQMDNLYGNITVGQEELQKTLASPRHYNRRRALVESELHGDVPSSVRKSTNNLADSLSDSTDSANSVIIHLLVDGFKITDRLMTTPTQSLCDLLEFMLLKHNLELSMDLNDYCIMDTTSQEAVILDGPSTEYSCHVITVKNKDDCEHTSPPQIVRQSNSLDSKEEEFYTVKDCLDYFDVHGLVELPLSSEEESYQLPRVAALEPIASEWEALPIDPQVRNSLSDKEIEQQRAIWELIYNEHSHLRTLETIVNVFMRCLELIHRAKLFTEDNYHNIFGYMEDLYHAHDQLWTYTFEPCLNKTYETNMPLDLGEIINRFPKSFGCHFEIYEQHCTLDSLNLSALQKATSNPGFSAYLSWCEARSECNRQKLKEMLAKPMQQLTRYHLLLNAIMKKTTQSYHRQGLEKILSEVTSFVHVVDNGLRMQEEAERVRDAMNRITSYSVANVPHELKDLVQSYTHLDLLAPMPDVELNKPRLLMVEGSLHFRDNIKPKMSAVYVFLFTDMLLITKPIRKTSADRYKIIHPPFKITSVVVHFLTAESICCLVLNDYNVLSSWFILKAHSAVIAGEWLKQITAAQQFYQDAMDKKAQTWKLMENLRSERILHGVENMDSLLSSSLSQSLWSISSVPNKRPDLRTESVLTKRSSTPSLALPLNVKSNLSDMSSNSASGDKPRRAEGKILRSLTGSVEFTNTKLLQLKRTSSFGGIVGLSRDLSGMQDANSNSARSTHANTAQSPPHETNVSGRNGHLLCHEEDKNNSLHISSSIQRFPNSDASSTESSEVSYDDDYSRGNGVARIEASTGYKLLPLGSGQAWTRKSSVKYVKPVLHSLLDLSEDLTSNASQSLPDTFNLPSSTSTDIDTREDAISEHHDGECVNNDVHKSSSCTNLANIATIDSISIDQVEKLLTKKKSRSEESLQPLDAQNLSPSFAEIQINVDSPPQYQHCVRRSSLVRSHSCSESSLFATPSNSSYFNIVYVRDMTYCKSQKPNVETVEEEEENQIKTKNDSMKESKIMEDIEKSLLSSSCTEHVQKSNDENEAEADCSQKCDESDAGQKYELKSNSQNEIEKENMLKSDNESKLESQLIVQKSRDKCEVIRQQCPLNQTILTVTDSTDIQNSASPEGLFTEINSFSESDGEVQLEPTVPETIPLTPGWQPCKSAPVESNNCLSSHASMDEITILITDKDSEVSLDESTAMLEKMRKTSKLDQANDCGGISTSNQPSPEFPVELLSFLTSESLISPLPNEVNDHTAHENIPGMTVKELSKMFEMQQKSRALTASLSVQTSKQKIETTAEANATTDHTEVEKTSKKVKCSPPRAPRPTPSPKCTSKVKHQKESEKSFVCMKRTLSRIPITTERRKSRGMLSGESNSIHRPPLAADGISVKQQLSTSQVSKKMTTRAKNPQKPKTSYIPEPQPKPFTKASSPSQSLPKSRIYRQSPARTLSPKNEILSNSNEINTTSSSKGVVTEMNTSLNELEKKSIPDARRYSCDETLIATNRTSFQSRNSNGMFEKCSTQAHSFGFRSKLKHRHTLDQIDVPINSDSTFAKSTKRSPAVNSPREKRSSAHQLHHTEKLSGNKSAS